MFSVIIRPHRLEARTASKARTASIDCRKAREARRTVWEAVGKRGAHSPIESKIPEEFDLLFSG